MIEKVNQIEKIRLDQLIVQSGYAKTRDDAQRLIRSGNVYINENRVDKPGIKVNEDAPLRVAGKACPYASRGGLKLQYAIDAFEIHVQDLTAADFGASNGGFTDCLLQNGIKKVFAVDVGHGQLDYRLQQDDRVVVMDKTNCRYVTTEMLGEQVDLLTADLSFISLKTVFHAVNDIVKENGFAIFLVKPQFEAGKAKVSKGGIVKNRDIHTEVLHDMIRFVEEQNWTSKGLTFSPITGKRGNIEFLLWIKKTKTTELFSYDLITQTVEEAHQSHTIK